MRKTINVSEVVHFALCDYCQKTGHKQFAVADKAVVQYIKTHPIKKEKVNVSKNHKS